MAKKLRYNESDIVILTDGRIFQVVEDTEIGLSVRWLDRDTESLIFHDERLYVKEVLSNDPTAQLVFLAARSIHARLNNLSKV